RQARPGRETLAAECAGGKNLAACSIHAPVPPVSSRCRLHDATLEQDHQVTWALELCDSEDEERGSLDAIVDRLLFVGVRVVRARIAQTEAEARDGLGEKVSVDPIERRAHFRRAAEALR